MTEVLVALIGAAGLVIGPVVLVIVTRRLGVHGAVLEEVREQVSNDHDSNLRGDVDDVAAAVERLEAGMGHFGRLFGTLSGDVRRALSLIGEHDAASALVVDALREADHRLAGAIADVRAEVRRHHPE